MGLMEQQSQKPLEARLPDRWSPAEEDGSLAWVPGAEGHRVGDTCHQPCCPRCYRPEASLQPEGRWAKGDAQLQPKGGSGPMGAQRPELVPCPE